ncbi:flagellar assembly protein FliW [Peribacillus alkalitolerans]|uniref:flagellar assembly protein FliW n=1 Tax=Peribacillus alkalitolerans TaxID=1550385 RepID=UPI0013CF41C9|nr:flagellar assembly protein FliW [Peribacillus alkalitolerans]
MEIKTKYHDTMNIEKNRILNFEKGIPGLPEDKEYILLPLVEAGSYQVLQSISDKEIAFIVVSPFVLKPDYDITLDPKTLQQLDINSEEDVIVFSIITLREPFENSTMNLVAPVVINQKNRKAKQVVLQNTKYTIREPLNVPATEKG